MKKFFKKILFIKMLIGILLNSNLILLNNFSIKCDFF